MPQPVVLDRVSVVVSHAGAGTMLAAAVQGRPQLVLPKAADQWDNADAVVASGAALERLLRDRSISDAAGRVAAELDAMPTPADHVATIEALAT